MNELWLAAIAAMNIIGFAMMGIDKKKARNRAWRIPEKTLWTIAFFGGAIGTLIGMYIFHHKTKHIVFKLGLPILSAIQIILFLYFW